MRVTVTYTETNTYASDIDVADVDVLNHALGVSPQRDPANPITDQEVRDFLDEVSDARSDWYDGCDNNFQSCDQRDICEAHILSTPSVAEGATRDSATSP